MIKVKNYTSILADCVTTLSEVSLEPSVINQVRRAVMDYYCAAIAGSKRSVSQNLYEYLLESSGVGGCNVVGQDKGLSPEKAAYVNGTSSHSLDVDDGHTSGSVHPGTVVIPAVMSCAQDKGSTSEEIVRAILIGYEICIRISTAINPLSRKRGFHNTPVAGIFAATAAVGYLNGFDSEKVKQAFGVAASFASGLFAFLGSGSEIKRLHPGKAAHDAIMAVELVKREITGPTDVFENKNGVFQAFAGGEIDDKNITDELGTRFAIMDIYFKPYPCCRHLHSTIDAIFDIKENPYFDLKNVMKINIGVNKMASLHNHKECNNLLDAQMSLPYAAAASIVFDRLNVDSFEPNDAPKELSTLCDKVNVRVDPAAEVVYPEKRVAIVDIKMKDGGSISQTVEIPKGEPKNPVSNDELKTKFMDNCVTVVGKARAEQFVERLECWPNPTNQNDFLFTI